MEGAPHACGFWHSAVGEREGAWSGSVCGGVIRAAVTFSLITLFRFMRCNSWNAAGSLSDTDEGVDLRCLGFFFKTVNLGWVELYITMTVTTTTNKVIFVQLVNPVVWDAGLCYEPWNKPWVIQQIRWNLTALWCDKHSSPQQSWGSKMHCNEPPLLFHNSLLSCRSWHQLFPL